VALAVGRREPRGQRLQLVGGEAPAALQL